MEQLPLTGIEQHWTSHVHFVNFSLFSLEIECAMCEAVGDWKYAWPWYEGPVANSAISEGGYQTVCGHCYRQLLERFPDS